MTVCFLLVNEADDVFTLVAESTGGQVDVVIPMLRITLFFSG